MSQYVSEYLGGGQEPGAMVWKVYHIHALLVWLVTLEYLLLKATI